MFLPHLETNILTDVKMSLVYITVYVTRNDDPVSDDTQFYFHNFGSFLKTMDRGGLNIPTDSYCQWVILCYIMFNSVKGVTCRRSLNNLFLLVSDRYDFKISRKQCYRLCNIFFKSYSLLFSSKSDKKSGLKVLKLSIEFSVHVSCLYYCLLFLC